MKAFFKRLWAKLFGPKRAPKHLDYDTTRQFDDTGKDTGISKEANAARKQILKTELEEGDSYRLGPEARVHVGPKGKAGKAWITKRVQENQAKRDAKFAAQWEEKRARCIQIMMMSPEELKASGVYDEVQKFLGENEEMVKYLQSVGAIGELTPGKALLDARREAAEKASEAPSGHEKDRLAKLLEDANLLKDGKTVAVSEETAKMWKELQESKEFDVLVGKK